MEEIETLSEALTDDVSDDLCLRFPPGDQPNEVEADKAFAEGLSRQDQRLFWSLCGISKYVVRTGLMTLEDVRNSRNRP